MADWLKKIDLVGTLPKTPVCDTIGQNLFALTTSPNLDNFGNIFQFL